MGTGLNEHCATNSHIQHQGYNTLVPNCAACIGRNFSSRLLSSTTLPTLIPTISSCITFSRWMRPFPGNHGLWRALHLSSVQLLFYIGIILWEALNACLLWSGAFILWRSRRSSAQEFYEAKRVGILALTAGLLLWMVAFLCVGGEYFLMWQSKVWNGQEAASRMFLVEACVLLLLLVPEPANRTANSDQTGIQGEPSQ